MIPYELERIEFIDMGDGLCFLYRWPLPVRPERSLHSDLYWQIMEAQEEHRSPPFPSLWESVAEIREFKMTINTAWTLYQQGGHALRTFKFKWDQSITVYENCVVWAASNSSSFGMYRSQNDDWFRFMDVLDKLVEKATEKR